jgi:hypothetical protein
MGFFFGIIFVCIQKTHKVAKTKRTYMVVETTMMKHTRWLLTVMGLANFTVFYTV